MIVEDHFDTEAGVLSGDKNKLVRFSLFMGFFCFVILFITMFHKHWHALAATLLLFSR